VSEKSEIGLSLLYTIGLVVLPTFLVTARRGFKPYLGSKVKVRELNPLILAVRETI